jgi:hypothetical protein
MLLFYGEGGFVELVVETKYDSMNEGWCTMVVEGPFEVEVWKHIRWGEDIFWDSQDMKWEKELSLGNGVIYGVWINH